MIGSKEIEVMGVILEEDFKSGKCFLSGLEATEESWNSSVASTRRFCNPFKNVCKPNTKENWPNCKPRHDPLAASKDLFFSLSALICLSLFYPLLKKVN